MSYDYNLQTIFCMGVQCIPLDFYRLYLWLQPTENIEFHYVKGFASSFQEMWTAVAPTRFFTIMILFSSHKIQNFFKILSYTKS